MSAAELFQMSALSKSTLRKLIMPDVFISQIGTAKAVTLQCVLSSAYWRGTVTIDQCDLTAIPVDQ